jgi:hypothetical protein
MHISAFYLKDMNAKVSIHPIMVENSLLGAQLFTYSFHLLGNQFFKIMFILLKSTHIKGFKMTLVATVARRGNIPRHLVLFTTVNTKKSLKPIFKPLFFREKNSPE